MLRLANYSIVFQEVPDEVTLAINISNCPNRCKDCHSPHLWEDSGEVLDEEMLTALLSKYGNAITCVCFMGGDAEPEAVEQLAAFLQGVNLQRLSTQKGKHIKTAWYSGKPSLPPNCSLAHFDYIKLGAYSAEFGGLDASTTNQRFYRVEDGKLIDITARFTKASQ